MDNLFKQLDLAIYTSATVHWWQHPLLQVLVILVTCGSIFLIIWLGRKRKVLSQEPEVQKILATLYQSAALWQRGTMDQREVLLILSVLVRKYGYSVTRDSTVLAMTDEQWLAFTRSVQRFHGAVGEAEQFEALMARYKFSGQQLAQDQIKLLFELVYQIIAKTSSGSIAVASGLFAICSSTCKT